MRWPEEAARYPSPLPAALPEVRYARISLLLRDEDEWRRHGSEGDKEQWKSMVLERARPELRQVLSFIAAASPEPLLFHCVAGKDRTGLIAALLLALADVTPAAIAEDYALSTERLRSAYLERYAPADPAHILDALRCPEENAHNMLRYLQRAGGIRDYLRSVGLRAEEIERLRARLRD
jgi:protein-tyrosine phosphatase